MKSRRCGHVAKGRTSVRRYALKYVSHQREDGRGSVVWRQSKSQFRFGHACVIFFETANSEIGALALHAERLTERLRGKTECRSLIKQRASFDATSFSGMKVHPGGGEEHARCALLFWLCRLNCRDGSLLAKAVQVWTATLYPSWSELAQQTTRRSRRVRDVIMNGGSDGSECISLYSCTSG